MDRASDTEFVATVVSFLSNRPASLVAATRHYLASPPDSGASTVYISPANVSYARPNQPTSPDFWMLRFVDGSELRVANLLPEEPQKIRANVGRLTYRKD